MRIAITGVASGIGAATAAVLKREGAEIVGFDIAEPNTASGSDVDQRIQVDMSDPAAIAKAVDQTDGSFDALLNIAGLPPREGLSEKVLQVNYFGLVQFTDAMLDKLNENASIVNLASRAGAQWKENIEQVKALMVLAPSGLSDFVAANGINHVRAYNLTKEAVIVWTMAQTEQMIAKGLRMNSVSPAAVSTGILDDFKNAFGDRVNQAISRVGRAGKAEEVAELVAFLAKPESHWIKGNDITIDGGMTALATSDALELKV